jgi:mannitol operon transcriptional antiterminator
LFFIFHFMVALTTRQRDMLHHLLSTEQPVVVATLAHEMNLTPRQVHYNLKPIKSWLARHDASLKGIASTGVTVVYAGNNRQCLQKKLQESTNFELVLTPAQRQQLFALWLLTTADPLILYQMHQNAQVSKPTVQKDLEAIADWMPAFNLNLQRRTNIGIWVEGTELQKRQAIAALAWGNLPFVPDSEQLLSLAHGTGLTYTLAQDAHLLPLSQQIGDLVAKWDVQASIGKVTYAEAQLGGRFSDNAVLHLALMMAVQKQRVQVGQTLNINEERIEWLRSLSVWSVANAISKGFKHQLTAAAYKGENAGIAMHFLAANRHGLWHSDLDLDRTFADLIAKLMANIATRYNLPDLSQDSSLKAGLAAHVIPACLRQRFGLWTPSDNLSAALSPKYQFEQAIARQLGEDIAQQTDIHLPETEINVLALLLRAAFIREQPHRYQRVIVVCPSGMATAQLLTARLKAHFPRLGNLEVLSIRELDLAQVKSAQLILTTVPLPALFATHVPVIQVHPLLLPEDIATITHKLTVV